MKGAFWSKSRLAGAVILFILLIFSWLSPYLHNADISSQNYQAILTLPNRHYPFGTDHFGRDMLARLASAIRLSLLMAALSVGTAAIVGTSLGIIAGWAGKRVDMICSAVANATLALPSLLLILLISALSSGAFWGIYLGIALSVWVEFFRVIRALTKSLVQSPQLEASQRLGFGKGYLFYRHIFPEIAPYLFTLSAFAAASSILAMSALGFIGVGLRPPIAELGLMMTELMPYYHEAPWVIFQPILALFLLILSLNLLAGARE